MKSYYQFDYLFDIWIVCYGVAVYLFMILAVVASCISCALGKYIKFNHCWEKFSKATLYLLKVLKKFLLLKCNYIPKLIRQSCLNYIQLCVCLELETAIFSTLYPKVTNIALLVYFIISIYPRKDRKGTFWSRTLSFQILALKLIIYTYSYFGNLHLSFYLSHFSWIGIFMLLRTMV